MTRQELLRLAHLALSAVFLLWNITLAGRITRQRSLPPLLGGLTALGGLLVAPAFLIFVAAGSLITGRTLSSVAWVWPVTAALIAAQAFYATAARLVTPIVGIPILIYDLVAAGSALGGYLLGQGEELSAPMAALVAASGSAAVRFAGPGALLSPLHTAIPILAPAHPSRWRLIAGWRVGIALVGVAWVGIVAASLRRAAAAVTGYRPLAGYELRARSGEPFAVGLEILPLLADHPAASALTADMALVGSAALDAVMVTIPANGARPAALDSLRRALEPFRRDSLVLIAAIQTDQRRHSGRAAALADSAHIVLVEQVARRLMPDYLLPLDDVDTPPTRLLNTHALARRQAQLSAAATSIRRINPRIRVAVSLVPGSARDSALHVWAASPGSPIDAVGFTLLADAGGGPSLAARLGMVERWMDAVPTPKDRWVFHAGGLPAVHGDRAQEQALTGLLGWAMARPGIRGAIVTRSGDYDEARGLRTSSGRLRPATAVIIKAAREATR